MWADFHFQRPLWLLLPLCAWLLIRFIPRAVQPSSVWRSQVDASLAPWVLARVSGADGRTWPGYLLLILLAVVCAGPAWEQLPRPQVASGHALVIALDLSRSMLAEDLRPNRLTRARFKLEGLFEGRRDGQTALVVFAANAFLVTPLTSDLDTLRLQLPVLEPDLMPAQGSRADRAYTRAVELLRDGGFPDGEVLLVTDGIEPRQRDRLVSLCARHGNRLSILAAATAAGAPVPGLRPGAEVVMSRLDSTLTQEVARSCGGEAVELQPDDRDIRQLEAGFRVRAAGTATRDAGLEALEWMDRGPLLLLCLLPWLAWRARLYASNVLLLGVVLTAATPNSARASDLWWLWQHPDEYGRERLEAGDPTGAAAAFRDPRWSAFAKAQAGDPEGAVTLLSPFEDAGSLYNRGTTLARLGRYEEALANLEAALTREPNHADAQFNHRLIKEFLASKQQGSGEQGEQDGETSPQQKDNDAGGENQPQPDEQPTPKAGQSEPKPGKPDDEVPPGQGEPDNQATEEREPPGQSPEAAQAENEMREDAQATEQWLARIPDDPGGLLRNKFLQQQQRGVELEDHAEESPW